MADKKAFILRINPQILKDLQKWADDEFRSVNGQIEYLLQSALVESGRAKSKDQKVEVRKKK
ncbi:MAG TPA: hypothetical protein VK666_14890 [Chryseolinea sp.]|nr:hypothetical protein [Chryseolinea sp.]